MKPLRVVYFGSPEPSRDVLASLIASEHHVVAVITQPDRKRGRGGTLIPTPVKELALEHSIDVYEPANKSQVDECVVSLSADVGVVVAYGRILSPAVLSHFPLGCINVHYSLLPRFRGAAPVERAILEGDAKSGVCIMSMDEGLDTGAIFASRSVDITSTTTTDSLFTSMNAVACDLLLVVLDSLEGETPAEQVGDASYAEKLSASDFFFDASTDIVHVDRKVRAGSRVNGAWTHVGDQIFRVCEVANVSHGEVHPDAVGTITNTGVLTTHDGWLECKKIQVPGKSVMDFSAWKNGVSREKFPLVITKETSRG